MTSAMRPVQGKGGILCIRLGLAVVLLLCGACTRTDPVPTESHRDLDLPAVEKFLRPVHTATHYRVGAAIETGLRPGVGSHTPTDIHIMVGSFTVPFGETLRTGHVDRERLLQAMTAPNADIQCLCGPEWTDLIVFRNQWREVVGAMAYAENHNSVHFIDATGEILGSFRFQRWEADEGSVLFGKVHATTDLKSVVRALVVADSGD